MKKSEDIILSEDMEIHSHDYKLYRSYKTDAFEDLKATILAEIQEFRVILDITPLSKLYSFKLQEYSEKYNIPSFYIGKDKDDNNHLIWFRK
ncbi:MAG: hypothetical protein EU549_04355 [Promethearchaeota archaeon]|nr:MAG: hypothetical protein EU549_04355 [Candidatus Lokiarchaeota archaeon]